MKRGTAGVVCGLALLPAVALGAGFDLGDQGARAAGRAGAFAARADDLSAIEYNPAGLARMDGTQIFLGNRFLLVNEEYTRAATYDWSEAVHGVPRYVEFEPVRNQNDSQLLGPMAGVASDFGLDDWAFALGVYAPPGVSSQRFSADGGQRYMLLEREVQILYYSASVAWKLGDTLGLGASLQWVDMASIRMELMVDGNMTPGVVNPVSSDYDVHARVEGADHVGFSSVVGAWFRPFRFLEVAVSGRVIPVKMKADCTLSVAPMVLDLDTPIATTRNGQPADDVTFAFTLPVNARAAVRYIHYDGDTEVFDIELDLGYEAWGMTDALVVDGDGLQAEVLNQQLDVDQIVVSKNWQDTYSVRLGGDWNVLPDLLTLRAGGFYESGAATEGWAYLDFITSHRLGVSGGFTASLWGFDLSASYTYVFQLPVVVSESESKISQQVPGSPCEAPYTDSANCSEYYLGREAAPANAGTYVSDYHLFSVALSYTF